jgi:hypothetical protein
MTAHGLGGYTNGHCRCQVCTTAMREFKRDRMQIVRADRVLADGRLTHRNATHGTDGGYTNWACRCLPCGEAHRLVDRTYRGLPAAA